MDVVNNCSGAIGQGSVLFNYWLTHDCLNAYYNFITFNANKTLGYNPVNQRILQDKVVNLFNTYFITDELTDNVTSPKFDIFQDTLLQLCTTSNLPGVCQKFLTSYCTQGRPATTDSPVLTNFCGCYTPPDPTILEQTQNPACDPLCHRALTSHQANAETGQIIACQQNVCAIEDVYINVQDSVIPGGINFNSVCSGCGNTGSNGCLCIVSGVNLADTVAKLGITVDFNEFCGGNSVCIQKDNNGSVVSVTKCLGSGGALEGGIPPRTFSQFPSLALIVVLITIMIVIIVLVIVARTVPE